MQIEEQRIEIDEIDAAIVDLLNQRTAIAKEIALVKLGAGLPVLDEQREDEVLRRISQANKGVIDPAAIARIYGTILDESRKIQAKVRAELATIEACR